MKIPTIFLSLSFLLLLSCNKNTIYSSFDRDFKNNQWKSTDVRSYEFEITDPLKSYDLLLDFSHVAGFQFANVPLKVQITTPDQITTTENVILLITDKQGKDLGNCDGDYCNLYQAVFTNKPLSAGKYTVRVNNQFNNTYLPNVLGFGIKVNISEEK